jgi:hypothetical protein
MIKGKKDFYPLYFIIITNAEAGGENGNSKESK